MIEERRKPRIAGKRGKLRPKPHLLSSAIRFADIIDRSKLPALPKGAFGHVRNTAPGGEWGMLGNDQAGDCVAAGACHETMLFAAATGRPIPRFDTATALKNYSNMLVAQGGRPYDPNDDSTDTGLDVMQAAQYRRDTGIVDADGNVHKIFAIARIDNIEELKIAIYCFGVAGLGLALPDSAEDQFEQHHPWDDLSEPPQDGHYPPAMGVNHLGQTVLNTWDDIQGASDGYIEKYADEMAAYLSQEYMMANGVSPELVKWADLNDYLSALGNGQTA